MEKYQTTRDIAFRGDVFSRHFIDSKSLFLYKFQQLPNITIIRDVDHEKVYKMLQHEFGDNIDQEYHYSSISKKKPLVEKEESVIVMKDDMVLEMGDGYCEFYFKDPEQVLLQRIMSRVTALRGIQRNKPLEINLITKGEYGLELTRMDVKRRALQLALFYEDDFMPVHKTILRRLNKKNDKGLVLLHGLPGTGKTTYLRYLAGKIKKRVLFIPPDMAAQIAHPELVRLLIDNPNSVLIIEDAENLVMQRQAGSDSSVSNLLNISDGLLSDFLNVQIVCTFNSTTNFIDPALLRKGRLIASYEFKRLSLRKAQVLNQHIGNKNIITRPMTLTEVMNQKERAFTLQERPIIGFRKKAEESLAV